MATLQASVCSFQITPAPMLNQRKPIMATLSIPDIQMPRKASVTNNIGTRSVFMDVGLSSGIHLNKKAMPININVPSDSLVVEKLYAIMEAVADRVEMHKNIGDQRNNWNTQLLTSINAITLAAATMAGIATTSLLLGAPAALALKLSSTIMYISATGLLIIMNKIQPSQLVEEQRNAVRLFQQLHNHIQTTLEIGAPINDKDVKDAMDKVLALDKAYPLPLLGGVMLPKFPSCVEPAVWWPKRKQSPKVANSSIKNGWNGSLEEEMRQIVEVIRKKDKAEYLRLGGKALKMNKVLALAGPMLTAMAALGSAFLGSSSANSWAAIFGIVGGAMASVVNTLEHGGQVGMVCEMYRNNAGFFDFMEESMENNYMEKEVTKRENGELLELKVALQLGRSLSELRDLASSSSSSSSSQSDQIEEFASKLF